MSNTGADTITELVSCYERREKVSRQFAVPSGLVPNRPVPYTLTEKMYQPDRVVIDYGRYAEFAREFGPWGIDRVTIYGRKVLSSGKLGGMVAKEHIYGLPSEKGWLTDLVRDNMPV